MRIAAAQTAPAWGDPHRTSEIVIRWIARASNEGVQLMAFGETFLSGYPYWLSRTDGARFGDQEQKAAYSFYLDAAVEPKGPEVTQIREAAGDYGIFTYVGVAERSSSRGSVYATLLAIDPERGIVSAHRKTMPTFEERLVWGIGDGNGLRVHQVGGTRVGGLNCWENWIPVARHSLYAEGEELHVAVWPGSVRLTEDITRFIAMEGRCYVLSAGGLLRDTDIADVFPLKEASLEGQELDYDGGSAIATPNGSWLVKPVAGEERLVVADIDPSMVRAERQNFDPAGHYLRSDIFQLHVDRHRRSPAVFSDG